MASLAARSGFRPLTQDSIFCIHQTRFGRRSGSLAAAANLASSRCSRHRLLASSSKTGTTYSGSSSNEQQQALHRDISQVMGSRNSSIKQANLPHHQSSSSHHRYVNLDKENQRRRQAFIVNLIGSFALLVLSAQSLSTAKQRDETKQKLEAAEQHHKQRLAGLKQFFSVDTVQVLAERLAQETIANNNMNNNAIAVSNSGHRRGGWIHCLSSNTVNSNHRDIGIDNEQEQQLQQQQQRVKALYVETIQQELSKLIQQNELLDTALKEMYTRGVMGKEATGLLAKLSIEAGVDAAEKFEQEQALLVLEAAVKEEQQQQQKQDTATEFSNGNSSNDSTGNNSSKKKQQLFSM